MEIHSWFGTHSFVVEDNKKDVIYYLKCTLKYLYEQFSSCIMVVQMQLYRCDYLYQLQKFIQICEWCGASEYYSNDFVEVKEMMKIDRARDLPLITDEMVWNHLLSLRSS